MKQAYLIMAHTNISQLCRLVSVLDHPNNDIFIHADKKWLSFSEKDIRAICKNSDIEFVKRIDVVWGDYSQIECEMNLFRAAVSKADYKYLHLISGFDFPLKPIEIINAFFERHYPAQFVYYDRENDAELAATRCREYHVLQRYTGKRKNTSGLIKKIEDLSLGLQRRIGINRLRNTDIKLLGKGANWVSITGEFATYLVGKTKEIEKQFKFTVCCDEVFLHTVLKQSCYVKDLYKSDIKDKNDHLYTNLVYTDWMRGRPYTFRIDDYDELIESPYMFARKFDETVDKDILDKIERYVRKSSGKMSSEIK
ncbi:MAG: hypothetical protein E7269_07250 [Lachnospiraceae bacterium]|nr:hypothetical protein [Lachnospiraceae bacterium]